MGYNTPEDIANRALQHCGVPPSNRITSLSENTKNAKECALAYHKVRRAELRENNWKFSIARAVLRPIDSDTFTFYPPTWAIGTTYSPGDIVTYTDPMDSSASYWVSNATDNLGFTPGALGSPWVNYFGPLAVSLYDSAVAYYAGELVYKTPGDGSYVIYFSRVSGNEDDPTTVATYDATTTYKRNDIVVYSSQNYISLTDFNTGNQPDISPAQWDTTADSTSNQWRQLSGVLSNINIIYPVGTGPSSQSSTKNVFRLPYGFLRTAPQDPKAGSTSIMGAPTNLADTDWLYELEVIISQQADLIILRFSCDWTSVITMDSLFCEALAARLAYEICESITQSTDKLKTITGLYTQAITKAKNVNGIEVGYEYPPLDDYIACRA